MAFFSGWLRADVYKEPRTGIEFPERIGSCKRGVVTPYEAAPGEAGIAIEYRSNEIEATVYVHALGDEAHKTATEFLKRSLGAVKELEARGHYSSVKIYELAPDKEQPGWKSAAFTSKSTNHFIVSYIHCKVTSGQLVKIRATTGNPRNDLLQSFATKVQEVVDRSPKKP